MLHSRKRPRVERVDLDWWLAYDRANPAPTFFARPAWSLALARTYPFLTPSPLSVRLGNGRRVFVPLMLRSVRFLPFRMLTGLPLGTYTMTLGEDGKDVSPEESAEAFDRLREEADAFSLTHWPLAPAFERSGADAKTHETALIDVRDGSEGALDRMDGRALRNARAALRRGIDCALDVTAGRAVRYYDLLKIAARAWESGVPSIPSELVHAVVDAGGDDTEIWFARHDGETVAGGLVLYGAQEAFFWSAAMRPESGNLRPSNALNVTLIGRAAERGMQWFNMGASDGLPGVARFKKSLGAVPHAYRTLSVRKSAYDAYRRMRTFLARGGANE